MPTPIHEKFPTACYVVVCRDAPDAAGKRKAATPAHLAHIERVIDEVRIAGPLFDEEGRQAIGSLFVFRTQSASRARELARMDPYHVAGVWASVEVLPFYPAAGTWIGGTTWQAGDVTSRAAGPDSASAGARESPK